MEWVDWNATGPADAEVMEALALGVVVVEFFAMLAGALPFGWVRIPASRLVKSGCGNVQWAGDCDEVDAWAAEYRERPRVER